MKTYVLVQFIYQLVCVAIMLLNLVVCDHKTPGARLIAVSSLVIALTFGIWAGVLLL